MMFSCKNILFLIFFTMAGCYPKQSEVLRVALNPWPGYEAIYFAREKKYFSSEDVKLIDYISQTGQLRAFKNNAVNAATVTLDTAIKLAQYDNDFKIVLVIDFSNGGDAILAKREIKKMHDLKNKRIGVEMTALGEYMLSRFLEIAGIKSSELVIIPLEFYEHERAFKDGKVDAIVTFDPIRRKLLKFGAHQIFDSSQIPGEIVDVLIVRNSFLQNGERQLRSLLEGWFKSLEDMRKEKSGAIAFMAKREQVSEEEFQISLLGLKIPNQFENQKLLVGPSAGLITIMKKVEKVLRVNGHIDGNVDVAKLLDGTYVSREP